MDETLAKKAKLILCLESLPSLSFFSLRTFLTVIKCLSSRISFSHPASLFHVSSSILSLSLHLYSPFPIYLTRKQSSQKISIMIIICIYCLLGTVLSVLYALSHLISISTLLGRYYYNFHCLNENI